MDCFDYSKDDDFLALVSFGTQDTPISSLISITHKPTQIIIEPQTQNMEEGVGRGEGEPWGGNESGGTSEDSDYSLDCDDDLLREELQYDVEEMYEWRTTNKNLRRIQLNRNLQHDGESNFHENHIEPQEDRNYAHGSSSRWPSFFTTYEGGYESDQRASDDEGDILSQPLPSMLKRLGAVKV